MSRAQHVLRNVLAPADTQVGGARPWDIQAPEPRRIGRVLPSGPVGFGVSHMHGSSDCEPLDAIGCPSGDWTVMPRANTAARSSALQFRENNSITHSAGVADWTLKFNYAITAKLRGDSTGW